MATGDLEATQKIIANLTEDERAEYYEAFKLFDKDGDGNITIIELKEVMKSLNIMPTDTELQDMVNEVDRDKNGTIEFEEFLIMMIKKQGTKTQEDELKEAFKVFDLDNDGTISKSELKQVMSRLGEKLTDAEIEDMIKSADKDGNGLIDFEEFKEMFIEK